MRQLIEGEWTSFRGIDQKTEKILAIYSVSI